ncbi:MAG: hypothetical protein ING73_17185, partial [Rhodocyclaceae bacterium]|nr:hypothetical protein [Rhodocyclaceae bacterium]
MAIVTFPSSLGGDNSQVSDDSSPTTGLANGGHRTRFVAALIQLVAIAQNVVTNATTASAAAVTAVNAPATNGSSATSLTVAVGAQAFTTQTGKAWVVGQPVAIARTSAPAATLMNGTITAYNSG